MAVSVKQVMNDARQVFKKFPGRIAAAAITPRFVFASFVTLDLFRAVQPGGRHRCREG